MSSQGRRPSFQGTLGLVRLDYVFSHLQVEPRTPQMLGSSLWLSCTPLYIPSCVCPFQKVGNATKAQVLPQRETEHRGPSKVPWEAEVSCTVPKCLFTTLSRLTMSISMKGPHVLSQVNIVCALYVTFHSFTRF